MSRYPLRYWFMTSVGLMLGGAMGISESLWTHSGHEAVPGTFAALGLCMLGAVKLSIRSDGSG
jgi:hypothetical protein